MKPLARTPLLVRLLLAYLVPTLGFLFFFGWLAHRLTQQSLEASLGERLVSIAQVAASQIRPSAVTFLAPGDDQTRTATRLRRKLELLRERTQVARLLIVDPSLRIRIDTDPEVRIGDRYYHAEADRLELADVFAGRATASTMFEGADGRPYRTGYAAIRSENQVVAAIAVEGSAEFFADLDQLRRMLFFAGAVIALLVVVTSLFVARRITQPLRRLAEEAERIGAGELQRPVAVTTADEVGVLAATMNEMRQGLYQRDQQLQMMLSGIAHEVRNPLGGIALFAGLLRQELESDQEKLKLVQRVEQELESLKRVVEEFLAYTRKTPLEFTSIDLVQLIEQVAEIARPEAGKQKIDLKTTTQPNSTVQIEGDAERLRRVFLNLVQNAIQASQTEDIVEVQCAAQETAVVVTVSDRGCGIAEGDREKIFQPFFTTREKGTGLGLALSEKIVREHGGSIEIQDRTGGGTTVQVLLPRANCATS